MKSEIYDNHPQIKEIPTFPEPQECDDSLHDLITVIDAPCGSGKTEYIIQTINRNPDTQYLYISPFRSMFDRIEGKAPYEGRGTKRKFYTPNNKNSEGSKLHSIKDLIRNGESIMSTHALFLSFDEETVDLLKMHNYHLIIDEALETIAALPNYNKQDLTESTMTMDIKNHIDCNDIDWLLKNKCVQINEQNYNQLLWVAEPSDQPYKFSTVEKAIKTGAVYYLKHAFLVWVLPTSILTAFKAVTVLTYRFNNSIMKGYFDFFDLPYNHTTLEISGSIFQPVPFSTDIESGEAFANLIQVEDNDNLNRIGNKVRGNGFPFSKNWYDSRKTVDLKIVKNNTINFFRHYCNAKCNEVMWTTFVSVKNKIKPKGYSKINSSTETFVSCNSRSTEAYNDRKYLAYLVDRHIHPGIQAFLTQKDIFIDEDEYALSELIQWIFRSRVRNNRNSDDERQIRIYIPSKRMRCLLLKWLHCEEQLRNEKAKLRMSSDCSQRRSLKEKNTKTHTI